MDKAAMVRMLEEMAVLLEYHGGNPFKVRAFQNAARALAAQPATLNELLAENRLETIEGIGKSISAIVREAAATGTSKEYDDLRQGAPSGFHDLIRIPNLGPKRLRTLVDALGIQTIEELEAACRSGKVAQLQGFGSKSEEKILSGIEQIRRFAGQWLYAEALAQAGPILELLRAHPAVEEVAPAGSLRRCKEIVRDLDFVVASSAPQQVITAFTTHAAVREILGQGTTKASVVLDSGMQADLRVVAHSSFPAALQYFTGSKEHNTKLRARARRQGYRLNEYGLFRTHDHDVKHFADETEEGELIPVHSEIELYHALGLEFIEPELREDMHEIEAAEAHRLPTLVRLEDYRGVLHCHSTWSDGKNSIEELAQASLQQWKWQYMAICDHSQAAAYANGLKLEDLNRQQEEIQMLNRKFADSDFRILSGCECDILSDGRLDYPDKVLSQMDVVVVSIHSRFQMTEEEMTERLVRAVGHPYADILGHISGRLLLTREAYKLDYERVFEALAQTGTILEINGDPNRLDLDWRMCKRAKEMGIRFAVNPDAHSTEGLYHVVYGINVARKGWLEKEDIVNCLPLDEFIQHISLLRRRKLSLRG